MKISASNDHWVHLRHNSVPHERPLRDAQRNLTDRGVLSRQHKAPVEPRGNRILNHVTHIAAVTQLRHDTNGRVYFDKKIAEGKTPKEAIRALKRRISNAVHKSLITDAARPAAN